MQSLFSKIYFILIVSVFISSCTDLDDTLEAPSDFYYIGSLPIPFYSNGNSDLPSINWGSEVGIFNLNDSYIGVGVNTQTGILSWNENLPIGESIIYVTATNSAGAAIAMVTFLHQFSGQFNGGYNSDPSATSVTASNLNILFNVDGTMSITDEGNTVNGTWNLDNSKLICLYSVASVNYELAFDLTYSVPVNPFLEGYKKIAGSTSNSGFARLDYIK